MPTIGYGVYLVDPSICAKGVKNALEVGYRKIDTAQYYYNEKSPSSSGGDSFYI